MNKRYLLIACGLFILLGCRFPTAIAQNQCGANGSSGCWASACVFTQEAIFDEKGSRDGYRRAEYIIPTEGIIRYRTAMFYDAACTQVDPASLSEWYDDSKPIRKRESVSVDEQLSVETVSFGPLDFGNRKNIEVVGKFYLIGNELLCMSSNIQYGEDGPALSFEVNPNLSGEDYRNNCLQRMGSVTTHIVGTLIPPYPQGFESWEGSCIRESDDSDGGCTHTIGILQYTNDGNPAGIFAGAVDGVTVDDVLGEIPRYRVTDFIDYPEIPINHELTYFGCSNNGVDDERIIAVVKLPTDGMLDKPINEVIWAKQMNTEGVFIDVDVSSIQCLLGVPEGANYEEGY